MTDKPYGIPLNLAVSSWASPPHLLLVMCPVWDVSAPPLGLAYLVTQAVSRGLNADAWDLNIDFYNAVSQPEIRTLWSMETRNRIQPDEIGEAIFRALSDQIEQNVERIARICPPFVGFSVHEYNIKFTELFVNRLRDRAPEIQIIYGGPEVYRGLHSRHLQNFHADAYVLGEGEETLIEAIDSYSSAGRFVPLPGLIVVEDGQVVPFEPRPPVRNLDAIPHPTFREFDLHKYVIPSSQRLMHLPLLFSRGCIGQCSFCTDYMISGRYRVRPADHMLREIRYHVEANGMRHFGFSDLACNGNPLALERFCDSLIDAGLDIVWYSYAIILPSLSTRLFQKMRASGCSAINFGLESASDRVLELMEKYYTGDLAERVIRDCHRSGIQVGLNIIVGYPGETRQDHMDTLAFLERNAPFISRIGNVGTLLLAENSRIERTPKDYGVILDSQNGTWITMDGNTVEERNRRLEEVLLLLSDLGLKPVVVNREPCEGEK